MTVLLLSSQFGCLLFLFLVWLLWLESPIPCWMEEVKADILVFSLILVGKFLIFCPLSIILAAGLLHMAFIMLRNAPSIHSHLATCFYHKWVLYLIKCFSHVYWYDQKIFVFPFVYVMYYVYWFVNTVTSLNPWDESHLIMVYDLFDVFLDVICKYFVEDFSICSSVMGACSFLSLLCLSGFGIRMMLAS